MRHRLSPNEIAGVVLVGTHPWASTAFDRLLPRTLLPIAHRPLLSYALFWLHGEGIRDVSVCANRETKALESRLVRHVPDGMTAVYYEDPMPRGAAGAFRDAAIRSSADTFVVTDGSSIPNANLRELLAAHTKAAAAVTVVVHPEPARHGNPGLQVPSGIYVFDRSALDAIPARGFFDIKENLLPALYRSGQRVIVHETAHASPRVLDASSYLAVNEWMVEHLVNSGESIDGYVRTPCGLIHREAVVADDAVLVGPLMVGPGARVMSGAVIVGPTSIGRDALIGPGVLVSRSAIWRRCSIGDRSVADRCILSDDAVVEADTHAFRNVLVGNMRAEPETIAEGATGPAQATSQEFMRRIGRLWNSATWLRSPAPQ
jgi:NDP-sugar pyrophosphorylase family protein